MSLKQRVYPLPAEEAVLRTHLGHARLLYNIGLEHRSYWRRGMKSVTVAAQMRELTDLRSEIDWLKDGSTVVQQGALRDLDRAFQNFFAGRASYPRFRSGKNPKAGFVVRDLKVRRINRKWAQILIPKAGWVRFRLTYQWADAVQASSARITLHNGQWDVSLTTPPRLKVFAGTGAAVGIDVGVANTIATSDSIFDHAPDLTDGEKIRFLTLERRLARQQKGSHRRQATLDALSVLRRRLGSRRTDWVEQTTTRLARTYDMAAVEDLRIGNMVRRAKPKPDPENPGQYLPNGAKAKSGLSRAILASCWGQFTTRLDHKMIVIRVNPRNTSRRCHNCKHVDARNRESQAAFECVNCGHTAHADTNAAENILAAALAPTNPGTHGGLDAPDRQRPKASTNCQVAA